MSRVEEWGVDPTKIESDYVVSGDNAEKAFALFNFRTEGLQDRCIALKNAHDMSLAFTVGGGVKNAVCTNLDLFPVVATKHKHTRNIRTAFLNVIEMALAGAWTKKEAQVQRWQETQLKDGQIDNLLMESMRQGVLPSSKLSQAYDSFMTPEFDAYGKGSAWTAHSAITHTLRGSNLHTMQNKTTALGKVVDRIIAPQAPELVLN
jgi:hypothetical protein